AGAGAARIVSGRKNAVFRSSPAGGAAALPGAGSARFDSSTYRRKSIPENTCWHAPQRTRPRRSFSWSGTTLKLVLHWGQVVASAIDVVEAAGKSRSRRASGPDHDRRTPARQVQPSSERHASSATAG